MGERDRECEELEHEVEQLRTRLSEVEETLRAIRSGEVDALVITGEQGEGVDLSALAAEVAAELKKRDPQRRVEFVIQPGLVAYGDAALLRIVLENLLGNAWKFTSKKPNARIEFGAEEHDGETAYFVRDNGVGFDMAYADKLFVPFQRLHAADEYPGTGIGLATVKRIIQRHGGRVRAYAEPGKGATFYFTL